MKVSVVIPTFNRGYVLRDALESALGQNYRDFEILVVDDGSSDNTREVVQGLASEKIRFIWHDENRGCSAAYNTGISFASGQLVGFLDSDDMWKSNYLERQVSFFLEHPEADAVFTDTEIRGDSLNIQSLISHMKIFPKTIAINFENSEYLIDRRRMYLCLLEEIPIKPSALVVKREIFQRMGAFDEAWPSGTDWELMLRFSRSICFGYINQPLVVQRRTEDATHEKYRERDKIFLLNVFLNEKANLQNDREAFLAVNRGISSHYRNLAWHYLHSGQRKKSVATYLHGFKETRQPMMLIRAAAALVPTKLRNLIKSGPGFT